MAEMAIEPQMGLTFEQVWATIQGIAEQHKETEKAIAELAEQHKETERFLRESKADTERQIKETALQMKETDRRMGDLTRRFGEVAEHLVLPNIIEKFNALGYDFVDTGRERKFKDRQTGRFGAEVDILLENGSYSIAVEVKVKPDKRDVEDHIKRLEFLRRYKDGMGDKREIRGALAGAILADEVREAALSAGLYVLEQSGDTVKVVEPPEVRGW
jgi:hypothetical protein